MIQIRKMLKQAKREKGTWENIKTKTRWRKEQKGRQAERQKKDVCIRETHIKIKRIKGVVEQKDIQGTKIDKETK